MFFRKIVLYTIITSCLVSCNNKKHFVGVENVLISAANKELVKNTKGFLQVENITGDDVYVCL